MPWDGRRCLPSWARCFILPMTVAHSKGRPGKRPNRSGFSEVYFRPDDLIDRPKRQLRQYTEEYTTSRKTADVPTESIQRDHYFLTDTQAGNLMTFAKRPKINCGRSRRETLFRRNIKFAGLTMFSPTKLYLLLLATNQR